MPVGRRSQWADSREGSVRTFVCCCVPLDQMGVGDDVVVHEQHDVGGGGFNATVSPTGRAAVLVAANHVDVEPGPRRWCHCIVTRV